MNPCAALLKLTDRCRAADTLLCVGLDPEWDRLPGAVQALPDPLFSFCREVIDATAPFCAAFKPNTAFFESRGPAGWLELSRVCAYLRATYPQHFLLLDAKRGDTSVTSRAYAAAFFDELGADAVTLHPYLGEEALLPFLERTDRVSIVLARTSNPGAVELQDLSIDGRPLWEHVATRVARHWNHRGNCMLVVGATWPGEMRRLREIAPEMPFLVPGIGAQGGDVDQVLRAGLRPDGLGLLLSSSRAILYAGDPAEAARAARDAIRHAREQMHARN